MFSFDIFIQILNAAKRNPVENNILYAHHQSGSYSKFPSSIIDLIHCLSDCMGRGGEQI
jgi:hypothetical protein